MSNGRAQGTIGGHSRMTIPRLSPEPYTAGYPTPVQAPFPNPRTPAARSRVGVPPIRFGSIKPLDTASVEGHWRRRLNQRKGGAHWTIVENPTVSQSSVPGSVAATTPRVVSSRAPTAGRMLRWAPGHGGRFRGSSSESPSFTIG